MRKGLSYIHIIIINIIAVNQIIELNSRSDIYFEDGSVMQILRPLEVQGKDISGNFKEWKPESKE